MSLEKLLLFPIYWTNNNCSVSSPNIWKILLICCMKELSDKKIETPVHLCCADLYLSITQEKLIKIQSEFIKIDWQKQHNKKKKKAFVSRLTLELLFCTTRKKPFWYFCSVDLSHSVYCQINTVLFFCSALPFSSGNVKREYTLDFINFPVKDFVKLCVSTCDETVYFW